MNLSTLTDDELLRQARNEFDPLTGTDLEAELLKRFEDCSVTYADNEQRLELCSGRSLEECKAAFEFAEHQVLDEVTLLLAVLAEFDIDDPGALKKVFERNAKFEDVLNALAEPLASLQALVTQE